MAASAAFFPLTTTSAAFRDSKRSVPGFLTSSYTTWSIKPSIHELVVDLALCSQYLAVAGLFKSLCHKPGMTQPWITNQSSPAPTNFSSGGNNSRVTWSAVLIANYLFKHIILTSRQVTVCFTTMDQSCILILKFHKFYLVEHQMCLTVFRLS